MSRPSTSSTSTVKAAGGYLGMIMESQDEGEVEQRGMSRGTWKRVCLSEKEMTFIFIYLYIYKIIHYYYLFIYLLERNRNPLEEFESEVTGSVIFK